MDNGWTPEVVSTVNHWISNCTRLSIAYDNQSDTIRLRIRRLNKISLLVSLSSLISSVIQLSNGNAMANKVIILVSTALSGLIVSYMTIEDLPASLELYTSYNERLKIFLGELATQVSVPPSARVNGQDFITNNMGRFQKLLIEKPNIIGQDIYYDDLKLERTLHRKLPDFRCTAWPSSSDELGPVFGPEPGQDLGPLLSPVHIPVPEPEPKPEPDSVRLYIRDTAF